MDSPLCYIGGKSKLSNIISKMLPAHKTYCEVFAGAAWVFFRKEVSKYEVINDLDGDLVKFYRVVQNHLEEFLKQFKWLLSSHEWFEDWKQQLEVTGLTDIQQAARYYYVQRHCYGGKVKGRSWGSGAEHLPRINLLRLEEEMSQVHLRLSRVIIENLDYKLFLERYDRAETVFYLDPPYYKLPFYRHNLLKLSDFQDLSSALLNIKARFILSINDHADMRKCFDHYKIRPVKVSYSASGKASLGNELLITNF
jgi:DNA adenine methylase